MMNRVEDFTLPNVAAGDDRFSLSDLPDHVDFAVLFLQRDHYCTKCRNQVQTLADRIDEFRERDAEVVSVVPEPVDCVESWQSKYEPPFPLLADPDAEVGDAYDQPVRFGLLGEVSDFVGRMPEVIIIDRRGNEATVTYEHRGRSTFDRPPVDTILGELDRLRDES